MEAAKGKGVWYLSRWKLGESLKSGFGRDSDQESGWLLMEYGGCARGGVTVCAKFQCAETTHIHTESFWGQEAPC